MTKLTNTQIEKIRKDFLMVLKGIDKLKISNEGKIDRIREFLDGYKKGYESCAGEIFNIKDIDIVFFIDRELIMFDESVGKVEPSISVIELIAEYNWGEIIKTTKK